MLRFWGLPCNVQSCICMVIGITLYQAKRVVILFLSLEGLWRRWLVTCEHVLSHFRKHWQLQRLVVVITWCSRCVLWQLWPGVCSSVSYTVIFFVRTTEAIVKQSTTCGNWWLCFSITKHLGKIPVCSPPAGRQIHIVYGKITISIALPGSILETIKGA